jgi:guanylate kinase
MRNLSREGIFLCLIGPAGGGKTTVAERLLATDTKGLSPSVSVTSRIPRAGEVEGKDYFFVTKEEFLHRVSRGEFFEWEETHGNLYGTSRETLSTAITNGTDLLLDIDIRGALTFKKHFPKNTLIVFLIPPTGAVLRERLLRRGSSQEELEIRLATALREYEAFFADLPLVDYFVVNEDREATFNTVHSILESERVRTHRFREEDLKELCRI